MTTQAEVTSLEELFGEVQTVLRGRVRNAEPAPDPRIEAARLFSDEANWLPRRFVALVHRESETLLGVYAELAHRSVADARRLVRAPEGETPTATEYISGDWLLEDLGRVSRRPPPETSRTVIAIRAQLASTSLAGEFVELRVWLRAGSPFRADLAIDTTFGDGETFISLPAGTDIYPQLDRATKIEIYEELREHV